MIMKKIQHAKQCAEARSFLEGFDFRKQCPPGRDTYIVYKNSREYKHNKVKFTIYP